MTKSTRETSSSPDPLLPGQVVLSVLGLAPTVEGLRQTHASINKSTVWRWSQPREKGGTGGLIPAQYHLPLLKLAQRLGKSITSDDLVMGRGN